MQAIKRCCIKESQSHTADAPKTVSIIIGFFFFINCIVGVGFLGIPSVFQGAGLLTSVLTLVAISLFSWVTVTWLLEVMSRAQAIEDIKNQPVGEQWAHFPNFRLETTRKFEQAELFEIFVHKGLKYFYGLVISISMLIALWASCTVAGQAWSINFPLHFGPFNSCANDSLFDNRYAPEDGGCLASYRFCVFLYAMIVIPLSLLDLREQSIIQTALGVVRFTLVGSMVLYCLIKMVQDACAPDSSFYSNCTKIDTDSLATFDFKKFLAAIPVFLYAQAVHPSVATLSHPIRQKKQLRWLVLIVLLTTTMLYIILGTMISLWFGDGTLGMATLNWFPSTKPGHSVQLRMLSYLIVLFPSLDVCTTYPLLVYTLVNNIYLIFMGRDTSQASHAYEWWIRLGMKAVIAVLPIMCAMFVANLLYVLTYGGLVTFFNFFFFPAVLQLASQWKCIKVFGNQQALLCNEGATDETADDENAPLMGVKSAQQRACGVQAVYTTPYSIPGLSHPIAVLLVSVVGLVLFTLAFVGAVYRSIS